MNDVCVPLYTRFLVTVALSSTALSLDQQGLTTVTQPGKTKSEHGKNTRANEMSTFKFYPSLLFYISLGLFKQKIPSDQSFCWSEPSTSGLEVHSACQHSAVSCIIRFELVGSIFLWKTSINYTILTNVTLSSISRSDEGSLWRPDRSKVEAIPLALIKSLCSSRAFS